MCAIHVSRSGLGPPELGRHGRGSLDTLEEAMFRAKVGHCTDRPRSSSKLSHVIQDQCRPPNCKPVGPFVEVQLAQTTGTT